MLQIHQQNMEIKVKYEEGVFKPLERVIYVREGEEFEIILEKEDMHILATAGRSFDFLEEEEDLYASTDIIN